MKSKYANYPWADAILWMELDSYLYKMGQMMFLRNLIVYTFKLDESLIFCMYRKMSYL